MAAVIFDLDGTLIDSVPDLQAALNSAFADAAVTPFARDEVARFIGNGMASLVARAMEARGLDMADHPHRHARMAEAYDQDATSQTRLYPGVLAALDHLQAEGHRLGLCTNKPEAPARAILAHLGLDRYFEAVVGGGRLAVLKPDPAPLRLAMAEMGVDEAIFVGDSEVDAATAEAAGLPFLLFTEGYRKSPAESLPQSACFNEFSQLPWLVAEYS